MTEPNEVVARQIGEIARQIERFAGATVSKKVMKGKDEMLATKDPVKGALWIKEAIDRLDAFTDGKTREKIMAACGRFCNMVNSKYMEEMIDMRRKYNTEEEFLKVLLQSGNGPARFEKSGNDLTLYYTPRKIGKGARCFCYLINMLPKDVNASPTYCQCARGFVQAHWEGVFGRPLKVELGKTAITGQTSASSSSIFSMVE
jgi:hypothetical protein